MMIKKYLWILLALFVVGGCESLEDTYSDYAGDGAIRYVGKCSDLSVTPRWYKLFVTWQNNVDPEIDKIKVSWTLGDVRDSALVEANMTEYTITGLENGNYEVAVCGVDKYGNVSMPEVAFCRPVTSQHDEIQSFTKLVNKPYFVKDRLVIFWANWSDAIVSAKLNYYKLGATEMTTMPLTKEVVDKKYLLVEDPIDFSRDVTIVREGRIEGCDEVIPFDPYVLPQDKLFTNEFKQMMKTQNGWADVTEEMVEDLEELAVDYNCNSLEDILYCPNLKKVVLGRNRYLSDKYLDLYGDDSRFSDSERNLFVLSVLAAANPDFKVELYNRHFFGKDAELPAYVVEKGNPNVDDLNLKYLDKSGWDITCSPEDTWTQTPFDLLFDGNLANYWEPMMNTEIRTHEIIVDFGEVKTIKGVRVMQREFDPNNDAMTASKLPTHLKVEISSDRVIWKTATWVEENTIGATSGESTVIYFSEPHSVQYLKFTVNDLRVMGPFCTVTLGELMIFE